jgi:hypothetical protein
VATCRIHSGDWRLRYEKRKKPPPLRLDVAEMEVLETQRITKMKRKWQKVSTNIYNQGIKYHEELGYEPKLFV